MCVYICIYIYIYVISKKLTYIQPEAVGKMKNSPLLKTFLIELASVRLPGSVAAAAALASPSLSSTNSSLPFSLFSSRNVNYAASAKDETDTVSQREGLGISDGLNIGLARRGVTVDNSKVFRNMNPSELQLKGASVAESLSGLPLYFRGDFSRQTLEISRAQFNRLLKKVTTHLSSISDIFVHDGAIGPLPRCNAKVRVISDCPSAVLSLSSLLWGTSTRAVSHDSCPLTVYVTTSISPSAGEALGIGTKGKNGFIVADMEYSSLVLGGRAFADANGIKDALAALSAPIISSRGGLPLSARLLYFGNYLILLFAPEDIILSCRDRLVSLDAGLILLSHGVTPLFNTGGSELLKMPAAVALASSDSSGTIPSVSKLSPGQAAYHLLAGYQYGKFVPAYNKGPSSVDPLELAIAFLSKLKDIEIPAFLINASKGEKWITGMDLVSLLESTIEKNIPSFQSKGGNLRKKYESFLSCKFQELPEEFSF